MENNTQTKNGLVFNVRLFAEITIKSPPVRKRWVKILAQNIRLLGRQVHERTSVVQDWDRIEVRVPCASAQTRAAFIDVLARIPGIANFSEVKRYTYSDMHDIYEKAHELWGDQLKGKSFCVRAKRSGIHDFTSTELERYVGGGLNQNTEASGVRLKNPDITVRIEVKNDMYLVSAGKYAGLGGFPMGTQEPVLSLVSGGFDSTVASYQMMQRGMRTHFCFFNLGGQAHETAVKEIAYFLWRKYASSHRVRFISVPFEEVVAEILEKIGPANMGVVLKRMMFRAAEKVADRGKIQALVTGEAISQVSSQTITNLCAIDRVTDKLVLRPLITTAKPEIIQASRDIGVEDFSASIPEYCGVISVKPSSCVNMARLLEEEEGFDFSILERAIDSCVAQPIDKVMEGLGEVATVEKVAELPLAAVVVDIRHPDEQSLKPLNLDNNDVQLIPFYKLNSVFENQDRNTSYYLYCEKGVMSELHASHLKDAGFENVGVYRPN